MHSQSQNSKGFTIIEVVLVLAIAGLIFLVVFLALPALQRSQRDTQRRSDVARVLSQITAYQSNSQGQVPTTQAELDTFKSNYMTVNGQQFTDPFTSAGYTFEYKAVLTTLPGATGDMFYYVNAKCNGQTLATGSGTRQVAVMVKIEQGGLYCQNN